MHIRNSVFHKFFIFFFLFLISYSAFSATTDLTQRFLDKANEAFEEDNIEDAYKYVNQALAVAKDEDTKTSVVFFAQTVYKVKIQMIQLYEQRQNDINQASGQTINALARALCCNFYEIMEIELDEE